MSIMVVVTVMIVGVWVALQRSYQSTSSSSEVRERARDAMSRMVREIRDSSNRVGSSAGSAITHADSTSITFRTAFNESAADEIRADAAGDMQDYVPPAGGFYYEDGVLYRWRDTDGTPGSSPGDRRDALATDLVNGTAVPVFTYTCINTGNDPSAGVELGAPYQTATPVDLSAIVSVQITLRLDLNPGRAPEYIDLISTAQPRNQRQT